MGVFTKFFGRTASEGAAFAMGTAVGPALRPIVQELYNTTWLAHPSRPIDPVVAAQAVAQGQIDRVWAETESAYTGINAERFDKLVRSFDTGPGVALAFQLWRRGVLDEAGFRRAVKREGLEAEWIADLVEIRNVLLSPGELANARQQGFIDEARQHDEAARQGITTERADIQFQLAGLPPGIETAMEMLRRNIIDEARFAQIVREGHTKTKYTDDLLALRHPVLSATQAATLRLKGWITAQESYDLGALTGYTQDEMERLYLSMGRPAAPVQMTTAWARGVDGPDGRPMDREQFFKGIRESDIRPEWGPMLWGIRHNYPTLFQLRGAVQSGGITRQRALTILGYERYEDQDAIALVDSWLRGGGTTKKGLTATDLANEYEALWITRAQYIAGLRELGYSDTDAAAKADAEDARRARLARNQLIARIRTQYTAHRISLDTATAALNNAGVPARVRDSLLPDWTAERDLTADALTPAQIKKAFQKALFTRDQAIARLEFKGYDAGDANIYLDETLPTLSVSQIQRAYRQRSMNFEDALAALERLGYSPADATTLLEETAPALTAAQIQRAYRIQSMSYEEALAALERLGYTAADATTLLEETGTRLTAAQVKKAWVDTIFTRAEAIQRLLDLGYTAADANTYLDE